MSRRMRMMLTWSVVILFVIPFSGCKKDDPAPSPNAYVNEWILKNMKDVYYWTDRIPASTNQSLTPDQYFKSILVTEDRFSWIQDNYKELLNSLQGITKEAGYEFVLYRASSDNTNVFAQVVYVKKDSPAEQAGLKRSDVIDQINGQQITTTNYQTLLKQISQPHSITYRPTNGFGSPQTLNLNTVEYAENPNFLDKVITINDRKIGYYVYNLFVTGPSPDNNQYNDEMDAVFARFQTAGITDLVLDLRFNSGGAERATVNLASLIGNGVDNTKIFVKRQYNAALTKQITNDPKYGPEFLNTRFTNKPQNVGAQLRNNRVYVLTSARSASASELLINGLKPFMDVFIIGNTTLGKNVGSFSIYNADDLKNTWGMQPIVVKSFNSLDQSDYAKGFTPNILDLDNTALNPLGDPSERLLGLAIRQITGGGRMMNIEKTYGGELGSSYDFKNRNQELVFDSGNPFKQ